MVSNGRSSRGRVGFEASGSAVRVSVCRLGRKSSNASLTDEIALSISVFKATKTGYSRQVLLKLIRYSALVDVP